MSSSKSSFPAALTKSKKTISTNLKSLTLSTSSASPSTYLPQLPPSLPEIFITLLESLRQSTTSLALACKPPLAVSAAIQQVEKLVDQFQRLISCVLAAESGVRTSTANEKGQSVLVEEWRDGVEDIGNCLLGFLSALESIPETTTNSGKEKIGKNNPYLKHTGIVWESIDRLLKDLSRNEVSAVKKRWQAQTEVVKDAWKEFKDFLEDPENVLGDGEEEETVSWVERGEFGEEELMERAIGGKMAVWEKDLAEAAKPLLGLYQILQATIPRYIPLLSFYSSSTPTTSEKNFQPLLKTSSDLVASFDTAISNFYPDQDEDEIEESMNELEEASNAVINLVRIRLREVSEVTGEADGDVEEKRELCRGFLDKWGTRLQLEKKNWESRRFEMDELAAALDEES